MAIFGSALIFSAVVAAIAPPPVVTALAYASTVSVGSEGKSCNILSKA